MIRTLARLVPDPLWAALPPAQGAWAFLGLGSNVGDRLVHLQAAVDRIGGDPASSVDGVSSVYETAPVGGPDQGPYLNLAARVRTRRSPRRLLALCAAVEHAGGREREQRWGPRTIDVDILLYGRRRFATADLVVPHPRLLERAFALIPLIEVAPGATVPGDGRLTEALAALSPVEGVGMIGSQIAVPQPGGPSQSQP